MMKPTEPTPVLETVPPQAATPELVKPAPWTEPHPHVPYLPKPTHPPMDWLVEHLPVNPKATPEAKALLQFLYRLSGKATLTGQHNFPGQSGYSTNLVTEKTGKTPALYGTDWGFAKIGDKDSAYVRSELTNEIIKRWQSGSIITLCWHSVKPTENEPVTFGGSVQGHLTDEEFAALLTPGTPIYQKWCQQVDIIADYLKRLQNARVPVLWRPYHEINGDWFWWNGRRPGTKQLFQQIYDRLVNVHELHNLLWVWNPDRPVRADRQFVDYFPGQDFVDVLALDCYGAFEQSYYDDLNALSDGKVMGIGETHHPPAAPLYATQPKWAFYMKWAVDIPAPGQPGHEEMPALRELVHSPHLLSLEDAEYRVEVNILRAASGLEPLTN